MGEKTVGKGMRRHIISTAFFMFLFSMFNLRGEAADVCCADNKRLAEIIEANGKYDQLIRYLNKNGGIRFIHVSWKRNGVNRKMSFNK